VKVLIAMAKTIVFAVGLIYVLGWVFAGVVYLIAWALGWWP
jgi:hypothetical protein